MRIGRRFNASCKPLEVASGKLLYVSYVKYLGVCLIAGTNFKCCIHHLKVKFYRVFNSIYAKSKGANSELVIVELLKSYCLPFLLYGMEAVSLTDSNAGALDNCINRIFGVGDYENVKQIRNVFVLFSIKELIERKRRRLLDQLPDSTGYSVIMNIMAPPPK